MIVAVLSVVAAVVTLVFTDGSDVEFTPPPFEENAVLGEPSVPDGLGYNELWQEGMTYRFSVCGNVTTNGREATVYFTNPEANDAWLKLRVLDQNGKVIGETGLVKPGEYVETVTLFENYPVGTTLILKIMGYEPETYHSVGAVSLRTSIGIAFK